MALTGKSWTAVEHIFKPKPKTCDIQVQEQLVTEYDNHHCRQIDAHLHVHVIREVASTGQLISYWLGWTAICWPILNRQHQCSPRGIPRTLRWLEILISWLILCVIAIAESTTLKYTPVRVLSSNSQCCVACHSTAQTRNAQGGLHRVVCTERKQ